MKVRARQTQIAGALVTCALLALFPTPYEHKREDAKSDDVYPISLPKPATARRLAPNKAATTTTTTTSTTTTITHTFTPSTTTPAATLPWLATSSRVRGLCDDLTIPFTREFLLNRSDVLSLTGTRSEAPKHPPPLPPRPMPPASSLLVNHTSDEEDDGEEDVYQIASQLAQQACAMPQRGRGSFLAYWRARRRGADKEGMNAESPPVLNFDVPTTPDVFVSASTWARVPGAQARPRTPRELELAAELEGGIDRVASFRGGTLDEARQLLASIGYPEKYQRLLGGAVLLPDLQTMELALTSGSEDARVSALVRKLRSRGMAEVLKRLRTPQVHVPLPAIIHNSAVSEKDSIAAASLPKLRANRCAVVGNGGSLSNATLGKEIDEHDIVIRVNQGPTSGYETLAGSRTSVRMLNHKWSKEYRLTKRLRLGTGGVDGDGGTGDTGDKQRMSVHVVLSRVSAQEFLAFAKRFSHKNNVDMSLISSVFVAHAHTLLLCARRRASQLGAPEPETMRWGAGTSPSTGFLAAVMSLRHCSSVSIYGIGQWRCPIRDVEPSPRSPSMCLFHGTPRYSRRGGSGGTRYHYFHGGGVQDATKLRPFAHHSFALESDVLLRMWLDGFLERLA